MPAAETTGGRPSTKLLQILFWAGVGLAPLAALLLLFGGGFVLQLAAVLAVLVVVLIGLSIALRPDNENVRSEIEEAMFEELDTLRDDIRGDITHAARATHGQLVERIGVLHETVDALRNQVDLMRGQLERTTRAAQQAAAAQHAGPQPVGSAAVPQGVLRHTETVQVTTKTMVVDPTDQRRDGTVYGARPEIPQQRRPSSERDADWHQRPGEWSDRDGQDWHEPAERARHDNGRVVDGTHWSEAPGRAGWTDRGDDRDQGERGGRAGSHDRGRGNRDTSDWADQSDRTGHVSGHASGHGAGPGSGHGAGHGSGHASGHGSGRGDWDDDDGDGGRAERGGRGDWSDRGDSGGRGGRGEWADGDRADRGMRSDRSDADPGRAARGDWGTRDGDGGRDGGRRRREERTDRGDGDRGRGEHASRADHADRGERSRGDHADRGGRGENTDRGGRDEPSDRTERGWGAERISRSERTERSEWTERSERSEWIERTEAPREESWTEQLLRERMARADGNAPSGEVERSGGRRRAHDPDDDAGSVTGVRTTDRWASVHSDERGGRELRMGERRAAVHADETGTHVRIEDRWASVRHEEYTPEDEPRRESPRRSEARRERERQHDPDGHWSESSYEEARRDDAGTTRWSEVRRDRPALGAAQAALPASPTSRWQDPAPARDDERVSRRSRHDDDEDYGWNGSRDEARPRPARQIVDFEGNDDRWLS
ncbi:hypothetical protein ACFPIJ_05530 [Dactylosporangium cerinum]|uniref:Uncharacterized protein n=1 Tax=Dactylosporangium cerinum TaxID=1434730 RepID=A0ABV9VNX2_9ACTN